MDFRTYLEDMVVLGRTCSIRFRASNGAVTTMEAIITDLYRDEDREYIMTDRGIRIELGDIREVEGKGPDIC
jgi:hypothetical protein